MVGGSESGMRWAVEAEGLSKTFGEHAALQGVTLKAAHGETVAIFGPNGAGKTTLIKVLATIVKPSSGKVFIDGLDIKQEAVEARRSLGVVSHQTFLYGNLTAWENLEFYARMYDVPRRKERIQEVIDIVGLNSRAYDRVGTFSRGMQQRLSIARCLVHRPKIILLDEPETGLDQQAIAMLWKALQEDGAGKRTVLYTTHSLERGLELCDRLVIMARGRIRYEGGRQIGLAELKQVYHEYTRV